MIIHLSPRWFFRWPGSRPCPGPEPAAGFTLIECIVYVAVLGLILGLALLAFYQTEKNHRNLAHNADDILRALRAGEQWRQDIRQATAPPDWSGAGPALELLISHTNSQVKYVFREGCVWRQVGSRPVVVLSGVAASKMERDPRQHVTGWRWEVELKGRQRVARMKPLFTFLAVSREEKR